MTASCMNVRIELSVNTVICSWFTSCHWPFYCHLFPTFELDDLVTFVQYDLNCFRMPLNYNKELLIPRVYCSFGTLRLFLTSFVLLSSYSEPQIFMFFICLQPL